MPAVDFVSHWFMNKPAHRAAGCRYHTVLLTLITGSHFKKDTYRCHKQVHLLFSAIEGFVGDKPGLCNKLHTSIHQNKAWDKLTLLGQCSL